MVVVLPTPLTPTKSHTLVAPGSKCRVVVPRQGRDQLGLELVDEALGAVDAVLLHPGPEFFEQPGGQIGADVGQDQGLLQFLPRGVVDAVPRPDRGEVAGEQRAGPAQAVPEAGRSTSAGASSARASSTPRRRFFRRRFLCVRRRSLPAAGAVAAAGGGWAGRARRPGVRGGGQAAAGARPRRSPPRPGRSPPPRPAR